MKPLAPNTKLQDRYKITELIGKGGMGEVYLAIDQRLGHSIALKRTTVGDDKLLTEAFEREARTLAQLRHSILPKVSDHFIENGEQYLVMEYISGDDLMERLKSSDKAFPLNWVMFWADQILESLNYLHTYDPPIIHRDIKPQNLKLTKENHIVLLDFGLSKNAVAKTQVTSSGSVLGYTPHYASMEQVRGTGTNAKSDIFSLSATLYHLLANEPPVDALTRADAKLSGLDDPLKPLTQLNPEVTQTISDSIIKGLELTQDKRFNSARDMQRQLRQSFNELQMAMSSETLAFNVDGVESAGTLDSEADIKTEMFSNLPMQSDEASNVESSSAFVKDFDENEANLDPTLVSGISPNDFSGEKTEILDVEDFNGVIGGTDLNATEHLDIPLEKNAENKTSSVNPAKNSHTENADGSNNATVSDQPFNTHDYSATSEVTAKENHQTSGSEKKQEMFEPNSSNETGNFENLTGANWDDSFVAGKISTNEAKNSSAGETSVGLGESNKPSNKDPHEDIVVENKSGNEKLNEKQSTTKSDLPPRKNSSIGKYIGILGGLGVFLFLLIGAVLAIGYYYSNGGFGTTEDDSVYSEKESETSPETQPKIEANPEITETENAEQPETTTDKVDGNEEENSTAENSETTSTEKESGDSDKGVVTQKPRTKTVTSRTKKTTTSTKPSSKTNARKTNRKKSGKKPVKKTPIKKKKVKDAGVL